MEVALIKRKKEKLAAMTKGAAVYTSDPNKAAKGKKEPSGPGAREKMDQRDGSQREPGCQVAEGMKLRAGN